jgi:large subunit ribosomal protein L30
MADIVKVQYVKSSINRPKKQKLTLEALGLRKLNQIVEIPSSPQTLGMIKKISHLVRIVE